MSLGDNILKFLGSKWFTLILGLAMVVVLPFTWHNFKVVQAAGQLVKFWWVVAVLIINAISIFFCAYKFLGSLNKKDQPKSEEW
ncbi:MAG: hypothetical protein M0R17_09380 [Candidatus Omnitrophica bacterium]|jgi:hypothetical protein|nr:hypothetical protein [Candidatus Omnitrophota bacterium]